MITLFFLNDVLFSFRDYITKKDTFFPAAVTLSIALLLFVLLFSYTKNRTADTAKKRLTFNAAVASGVLFLFNIISGYSILFYTTSWDPYAVTNSALMIKNGDLSSVNADYFSYFPNNRGILLLETYLFKLFNINDLSGAALCGMILQSAVISVSAYLIYGTVYAIVKNVELTENRDASKPGNEKFYATLSWWLFALVFCISPWQVVFYTDVTAMLFPIAALRIYVSLSETKKDYIKWAAIALLLYVGFKIKPTALIPGIAIFMVHTLKLLIKRAGIKRYVLTMVLVLSIAFVSGVFFNAAYNSLGIDYDPEKNTGPLHMIMMGLNDENHGVVKLTDVSFSYSFGSKEERTAAQADVIRERIENYGIKGLLNHTSIKALIAFNDGTFAWSEEGGFYGLEVKKGNNFFKELYYPEGRFYAVYVQVAQVLWYLILLLIVAGLWSFLFKKDFAGKERSLVIYLSVIGIFLYDILFEARARYLIVLVPVIIIAGVLSLSRLTEIHVKFNDESTKHPEADKETPKSDIPRKNDRQKTFDIARGIAMLGVIWGHFMSPYGTVYLYTFNLPLFFVASGYFLKDPESSGMSPKDFTARNAKKLLLPYLITGAIIVILKIFSNEFIPYLKAFFFGSGLKPKNALFDAPFIGPIWFLPALFFALLTVWFSLFAARALKKKALAPVFIMALSALAYFTSQVLFLPFSFQAGMVLSLYVYLGFLVKTGIGYIKEKGINLRTEYFVVAFTLLITISYLFIRGEETAILFCINEYPRGLMDLFGSMCVILTVILFSHLSLQHIPFVSDALSFIGKNSFPIFLIHAVDTMVVTYDFVFNRLGTGIEALAAVFLIKIALYIILTLFYLIILKKMRHKHKNVLS